MTTGSIPGPFPLTSQTIAQLSAGLAPTGPELIEALQSGATVSLTLNQLAQIALSQIVAGSNMTLSLGTNTLTLNSTNPANTALAFGSPTVGQAAVWVDGTNIQGVTASLVAGANISIGGSWPNQTITSTAGGGGGGGGQVAQDAITAHAGGGRQTSGASNITGTIVTVNTVATAGDSITLPSAVSPSLLYIYNLGANQMQVWSLGGSDTINGIASGSTGSPTGITQLPGPRGSLGIYTCSASGSWRQAAIFL